MATAQVKFTYGEGENAVEVTIDPKKFEAYYQNAADYLREEAEQKTNFKDSVETVSENTGLPKTVVSKYFKARFKDETKKNKELGEVFDQLDEALKK